jgi:hypothetical protein
MAKHDELVSNPTQCGNHRFCLDRVIRDDSNNEVEYAFVWRGTAKSKDGFILRPAYFDWEDLGKLIKKAFIEEQISEDEFKSFLMEICK